MRISDWSSDVCSSDLIRPHLPALAVRDQCVALERGLDLGRQRLGIGGRCTVAARLAMHLGDLAQHRYREQVRRDQERIQTRSEEHTSELQSLLRISYAVFCLKKKKTNQQSKHNKNKHNR